MHPTRLLVARRRMLQVLAVVGLSALSIYSGVQYWTQVRQNWNPDLLAHDPVSSWEAKIARVRLPAGIGPEVGYVADWDIDPDYAPIDQDQEYVLTQYALAPLIVRRGADYEWVIGNFTHPGADAWLTQHFPGAKIHYYGWGIYLIHRPRP